uniref:Uncharacterized protein n=1 Tax=Setaria digitata TaxID=48799 RepID=A0A915Q1B7_9BILA
MLPLSYTKLITHSPSILYFLLLILPSCAVGLTLEYVPDLELATKKNYGMANAEVTNWHIRSTTYDFISQKVAQEEAATQQDNENDQPESSTDLSKEVGGESNAKFENELKKNVGMLVRITPKMINYWATELKQMFQKELENKKLPEFSRTLMKLNVSVLKPRIHNIALPSFAYKVHFNNTMEIILHGGSAKLSSSYRAVYRTIREGHLEANLSNFIINLKLKVATTFAGKLLLEEIVCGAEVRSIDVKLAPKLHELIDQGLRIELDETISAVICEALEAFINKFEERLNKLIRSPVVEIKINDTVTHLLIDTTISNDISLTENYFDFPLLGTPAVRKLENGVQLMKSPDDKVKMAYLYVSESVLNIFLKQLATFGETELQLHADPEFQKMLRLKCSEKEHCMGDLLQDTELYLPNSGRMVIKILSPLVASVRNGFALIDLHLTSFITYKQENMDVKVLEFEWLITIHHSLEQNVNASLQVVELKIISITPYVEMIPNYDKQLFRLISQRKELLEKLLTQQCSLTRATSTLYKAVYCTATFRNGTLVISTGLQWSPELLQHFSLFS